MREPSPENIVITELSFGQNNGGDTMTGKLSEDIRKKIKKKM